MAALNFQISQRPALPGISNAELALRSRYRKALFFFFWFPPLAHLKLPERWEPPGALIWDPIWKETTTKPRGPKAGSRCTKPAPPPRLGAEPAPAVPGDKGPELCPRPGARGRGNRSVSLPEGRWSWVGAQTSAPKHPTAKRLQARGRIGLRARAMCAGKGAGRLGTAT